jgi:predicted NBD/HSP70 family sugar kinase
MSLDRTRLTSIQMQREFPGSNHARLLQLLYERGDRSRADLARAAGFTKATVSSLVTDMISEGLVVETRQRPVDGPGRPAVDLNIDRSRWQAIAIDLSPDHELRGAVLDLHGTMLTRISMATDGATGMTAVRQTLELVDALRDRADGRVLGVGVCAPGIVDPRGTVIASHNLGWVELPLQDEIVRHAGLPVCVENDANAAALAERDRHPTTQDFMLVKVGYGVGGGIVANGELIRGSRFTAGEIGHVASAHSADQLCVCGRVGCLEATLSLPRLESRLTGAASEDEREHILALAGDRLGSGLAPVIGALGLEAVVVSGIPTRIATPLLAAARSALRARLNEDLIRSLDIRLSTLGDDITLKGALNVVLANVLGIGS